MKTLGNFDIEKNTIYQLDQGYEHHKMGNNESKNSQGWNFNYYKEIPIHRLHYNYPPDLARSISANFRT